MAGTNQNDSESTKTFVQLVAPSSKLQLPKRIKNLKNKIFTCQGNSFDPYMPFSELAPFRYIVLMLAVGGSKMKSFIGATQGDMSKCLGESEWLSAIQRPYCRESDFKTDEVERGKRLFLFATHGIAADGKAVNKLFVDYDGARNISEAFRVTQKHRQRGHTCVVTLDEDEKISQRQNFKLCVPRRIRKEKLDNPYYEHFDLPVEDSIIYSVRNIYWAEVTQPENEKVSTRSELKDDNKMWTREFEYRPKYGPDVIDYGRPPFFNNNGNLQQAQNIKNEHKAILQGQSFMRKPRRFDDLLYHDSEQLIETELKKED